MMKNIHKLIVAVIFMASVTITNAQIVISPSDDMTTGYVDGDCGAGDPVEEKLWLANFNNANCHDNVLMKFDLSTYSGQTVTNASLKLYHDWHNPHNSPTPTKLYAVTETWEEDTWNHENNPTNSTEIYAEPNFTSTLGWYEIDITSLVNEWLSGTTTNEGIVIIPNSGTKLATLYSKEYSDANLHPYLEIEIATSIKEISNINHLSIFPNPINDKATIEFNINSYQNVTISINNAIGQQIKQICNQKYSEGNHSTTFSVEYLPNGLYFINIKTNEQTIIKKIVINN